MGDIFWRLLEVSLTGSGVILIVLLLRAVVKSASKRSRCFMWAVAGLGLAIPFRFESRFALLPGLFSKPSAPAAVRAVSSATAKTAPTGLVLGAWDICCLVWLVGVLALLTYLAVGTVRMHLIVRESIQCKKPSSRRAEVRECGRISGAFVTGVLRPRIYLPSGLEKRQIKYILMHEEAHIGRLDTLWRPLGFLVLTAHWFNPLCWLGYYVFIKDMELACDERVFGQIKPKARREYCRVLLDMSTAPSALSACPFAFGENPVKQRIISALSYKKSKASASVFTVAVCAAAAILLLPAAVAKAAEPQPSVQTEAHERIPVTPQISDSERMAQKTAAAKAADEAQPPTDAETEEEVVISKVSETDDADDCFDYSDTSEYDYPTDYGDSTESYTDWDELGERFTAEANDKAAISFDIAMNGENSRYYSRSFGYSVSDDSFFGNQSEAINYWSNNLQ